MTVSPKTYSQCKKDYNELIERLAKQAEKAARYTGIGPRLYLSGQRVYVDSLNPTKWVWDGITFVGEYEQDAIYVHPEPMPFSLPYSQYSTWIRNILDKEPLAIFVD